MPPANSKRYREQAYQLRGHPVEEQDDFYDNRDAFGRVYFSLIPFLAAEYFAEISYDLIPAGLVFPTGFLLFWAFYYTYYKPGFLEGRLSDRANHGIAHIPTLFLGVLIWFVKITLTEIGHVVLFRWARAPKPQPVFRPHARAHAAPPPRPRSVGQPPPMPPIALPPDVLAALGTMGLNAHSDWNHIHRRYRELAKQLHPDLNPDITGAGNRFITVDGAYRKLSSVKEKYFITRR